MAMPSETICAVATPPGRGGVGVIRISGPEARRLAEAVAGGLPDPRQAAYRRFLSTDGEVIDEGLVLYFPGPRSFTGEDVLELQCHGAPMVLDRILATLTRLGARLAGPGEFSQRAFLNGKLDLAQAEAIADLIAATTQESARAAMRSLHGEFSHRIDDLLASLIELRVYVESAIDFPDEEIDFLAEGQIEQRLADVALRLAAVTEEARRGSVLREGMTVVIAGRPNSGKSSLLNRLAGFDAAIVTDVEGTTRDVLREHIHLDGMPLHVVDTAGLRESPDTVEREGIRRAWAAIRSADRLLLLVDDRLGVGRPEVEVMENLPEGVGCTLVRNKIDLSGSEPGLRSDDEVHISARTGAGLEALRCHLKDLMGYGQGEGLFLARRRHLDSLHRTGEAVDAALAGLRQGRSPELVAEDLRLAQAALGEITGVLSSDDLLGEIFSNFCIGK